MYVLTISKATSSITSVIPCSLPDFISKYKNLISSDSVYEFLDRSAFASETVIGDFISNPRNYAFIPGRDYSDNIVAKKEVASSKVQYVEIPVGSGDITIPAGMNYLAIDTLIAAGGRGSALYKGGCGACLKSVILVGLSTVKTLNISLGAAGTKDHPNADPLTITIDGNIVYRLQGGLGSTDDDQAVTPDDGDRYSLGKGSGGYWEYSIGGYTFDGNTRSTSGPVPGYGGGGDYNQDGQPGLINVYFSDTKPAIDGPLINLPSVAKCNYSVTDVTTNVITQNAGDTKFSVNGDKPYLCIMSGCAGGGYGKDVVGGQAASTTVTWWRLYPFRDVNISVGSGGTVDNPDGGDLTVSYNYNDIDYTLLHLSGGKSDGTGGQYMVCSGTNNFNGKDGNTSPPTGITTENGCGGAIGANGGDGIITYALADAPPRGVKIHDALGDATYTRII